MKKALLMVLLGIGPILAMEMDTDWTRDTVVMIKNQPGHMILGFITSYSEMDSMLVVRVHDMEDTMKLTPSTWVIKKGKKISFNKLEKDGHVAAWFMSVNGQTRLRQFDSQ